MSREEEGPLWSESNQPWNTDKHFRDKWVPICGCATCVVVRKKAEQIVIDTDLEDVEWWGGWVQSEKELNDERRRAQAWACLVNMQRKECLGFVPAKVPDWLYLMTTETPRSDIRAHFKIEREKERSERKAKGEEGPLGEYQPSHLHPKSQYAWFGLEWLIEDDTPDAPEAPDALDAPVEVEKAGPSKRQLRRWTSKDVVNKMVRRVKSGGTAAKKATALVFGASTFDRVSQSSGRTGSSSRTRRRGGKGKKALFSGISGTAGITDGTSSAGISGGPTTDPTDDDAINSTTDRYEPYVYYDDSDSSYSLEWIPEEEGGEGHRAVDGGSWRRRKNPYRWR